MSALTDLFTSFANKIRSKVGGSQTYTPLEMVDAIDDVYDAGAASVPTPTPITPSNASPVALVANTPVNPTAGGYAIESYSSITPLNSAPASLSANSPVVPASSGYAIASYSSKTPSDTNPPSVSSGAIIKASAAGYLTKSTPVNLATPDEVGQNTISGGDSRSITVTKKPRYIVITIHSYTGSTERVYTWLYDVNHDAYSARYYSGSSYGGSDNVSGLPSSITSVTSSSVTIKNPIAGQSVRALTFIYY